MGVPHKVRLIGDLQGHGLRTTTFDVVLPMAPSVGMVVEFSAKQQKQMKTERTSFVIHEITVLGNLIECR